MCTWHITRCILIHFLRIRRVFFLDPCRYRYLRPPIASLRKRYRTHPTRPVVGEPGSSFRFERELLRFQKEVSCRNRPIKDVSEPPLGDQFHVDETMTTCPMAMAQLRRPTTCAPRAKTAHFPVRNVRAKATYDMGWLLAAAERTGEVEAPPGVLIGATVVVTLAATASIFLLKPGVEASEKMQERDKKIFGRRQPPSKK